MKSDAIEDASRKFYLALESLEQCAETLRGDQVCASDEAMRTEKAVTRAIEILSTSGFKVQRR